MIEPHSGMLIELSRNVRVELQISGNLLYLTFDEREMLNELIDKFDELSKVRTKPKAAQ